jgi:hypothetical protein
MNNSKRRRLAKQARKMRGHDPMMPTTENLVRIMRQMGTNRKQRRKTA